MKKPWAFICTANDTSPTVLRRYCRRVFELGYEPVCPKLVCSQFMQLDDPDERSAYEEFVRDKILRAPLLVVCGREQDAAANAQIGLAQKYGRICTTLDGLTKAVQSGEGFVS